MSNNKGTETFITILKVIITASLTVVIVVGGGYYAYTRHMNNKSGKTTAVKNQKDIENIVDDLKDGESTALQSADYYDEEKVYDIMHRMINTKIVAEDNQIWGELPIENDAIENLRSIINQVNYEDRDYLLSMLDRWSSNDFSEGVEEHNYLWGKLDGTIGKATSLRKSQ